MVQKQYLTPDNLPFMTKHMPSSYLHRELRSHRKVAVVRNPWSRLVSLYEYAEHLRENGVGEYSEYFKRDKISWDEFIDRIDVYTHSSNFYCNHPYDYFGSQTDWLTPEVKILRYEHLAEDYEEWCGEPLVCYDKKGKYTKDYRDYYSIDQIEKVRDWFRVDIQKFGWGFETTARYLK